MGKRLSDLIDKYVEPDQDSPPGFTGTVTYTVKVPLELKLKLEYLSDLFGVKKTPLLNEIVITAINQVFADSEDHLSPEAQQAYYEELQDLYGGSTSPDIILTPEEADEYSRNLEEREKFDPLGEIKKLKK